MRLTPMRRSILPLSLAYVLCAVMFSHSTFAQNPSKLPSLTLDEFFNSVSFPAVKVSPDGNSVVIEVQRADWDQQIFRKELWLYRTADPGNLTQLTQSGHDGSPQWSPDGQWIAFLSERKTAGGKDGDASNDAENGAKTGKTTTAKTTTAKTKTGKINDKDADVSELFLISPNGGEAFAITSGDEEVHAFAWSPDSKGIVFATREPWNKKQNDDHRKDWKDTIRFRGDERGDVLFRISLDDALARHAALGAKETAESEKDSGSTSGAIAIARTPLRVDQLSISHDNQRLAFVTSSVSERQEKVEDTELFLVNLASGAKASSPLRLTHNQAVELNLDWAADNRHLFFQVNLGSLERKYEDPQPRLYWIDAVDASTQSSGKTEAQRWFADYPGEVVHYTQLPDGSVLCAGREGTEVQYISQTNPKAALVKRQGWPGTYGVPAAAAHAQRIAFAYSATTRPTEVYIADGPDTLATARPITSFNKLFAERELPKAKPYRWTSDDGTPVEGMLMYPPGKFGAKNLPMFVFIHGGPQDADGNHFEADWYQWDRLAATAGWLVFDPR